MNKPASVVVICLPDPDRLFVYEAPPGPGRLIGSQCDHGPAVDPWGTTVPTGTWRAAGYELPGGIRIGPDGFEYCVYCGVLVPAGVHDRHACPVGWFGRTRRLLQLGRIYGIEWRPARTSQRENSSHGHRR